jgi:acyl-CoA dehydrogenase
VDARAAARKSTRAPIVLIALRPKVSPGIRNVRKIATLGIRSAFVGSFDVRDQPIPATDIIAEGRDAWDAIFGTITLGKFFLGFGSIGMCEHAMVEAVGHLTRRVLFGKPVIAMPHIRSLVATTYARLTAMKLYAYRALDYVRAASAEDRRHLLFCAVQKARVSTEGVKVMSMLLECVNAKGFESDTYFEMALRDVQLIPGLEGSTHINLSLAAQFIPRYFEAPETTRKQPDSLVTGEAEAGENPYLFEARTGAIPTITFPDFQSAYEPFPAVANVQLFVRQVTTFRQFLRRGAGKEVDATDMEMLLSLGRLMAMIAYGQLVAENTAIMKLSNKFVSVIFGLLVEDLSAAALSLAASPRLNADGQKLIHDLVTVPQTTRDEWDFVASRAAEMSSHERGGAA